MAGAGAMAIAASPPCATSPNGALLLTVRALGGRTALAAPAPAPAPPAAPPLLLLLTAAVPASHVTNVCVSAVSHAIALTCHCSPKPTTAALPSSSSLESTPRSCSAASFRNSDRLSRSRSPGTEPRSSFCSASSSSASLPALCGSKSNRTLPMSTTDTVCMTTARSSSARTSLQCSFPCSTWHTRPMPAHPQAHKSASCVVLTTINCTGCTFPQGSHTTWYARFTLFSPQLVLQHAKDNTEQRALPPVRSPQNTTSPIPEWVPLLWVLDWLVLAVLFPPLNNVIAFSTQP